MGDSVSKEVGATPPSPCVPYTFLFFSVGRVLVYILDIYLSLLMLYNKSKKVWSKIDNSR